MKNSIKSNNNDSSLLDRGHCMSDEGAGLDKTNPKDFEARSNLWMYGMEIVGDLFRMDQKPEKMEQTFIDIIMEIMRVNWIALFTTGEKKGEFILKHVKPKMKKLKKDSFSLIIKQNKQMKRDISPVPLTNPLEIGSYFSVGRGVSDILGKKKVSLILPLEGLEQDDEETAKPSELTGLLLLGERELSETYTSDEMRYLKIITKQLIQATNNLELVEELRTRNAELATSRAFQSAVLDSTVDAILTMDEDGIVKSINKSAVGMFGYEEDKMLGINVTDVFSKSHHAHFKSSCIPTSKRRKGEACLISEFRGLRKDGEEFDCEVAISELAYVQTAGRLFTVIVRDVSERNKAQEVKAKAKLERMEQQRQQREIEAQVKKLENELSTLVGLGSESSSSVTSEFYGRAPLKSNLPDTHEELVEHYSNILDLALEQISYRDETNIPEELQKIARKVGFLRAGPRDLIEIHNTAIRNKSKNTLSKKMKIYMEEGKLLLIQIMGFLVSYYRTSSIGSDGENT